MKLLLIATILSIVGCAAEWRCPNAPKYVAKFAVGERVAFSHGAPPIINRGAMGTIVGIDYACDSVTYHVLLESNSIKVAVVQIGNNNTDLEAVVYPDGALRP